MTAKRLKFAVLTSNSYFSYLILSDFLSAYRGQIAVVVETRGMMKGKSLPATVWTVLRRSGVRGALYKIGTAAYTRALDLLAGLLPRSRRSFGPLSLARRLGIEVLSVADANGEICLSRLTALQPDLVFSVNVYQLLKARLLSIPTLGVMNFHFGLLPAYRGMSPYMWAMARGEPEVGLTAHFMDDQFDTGDIVLQRKAPILGGDSAFRLYVRCCRAARSMPTWIARQAEQGTLPRVPQPGHRESYFPLPDRRCIAEVRRRGHPLVTLSDLVRVVFDRAGDDAPV